MELDWAQSAVTMAHFMGGFKQTPRAMVLAAGRGERLRPLTDFVPKPLLQVGGETLLGRHLRLLGSIGVTDVVVNTAWLGSMLVRQAGDGDRYGVRIHYSDEGDEALETGGGIFRALPRLGEQPFLLLNGDIWTDFDLTLIAEPAGDELASLVMVPNPPHNPAGDFGLVDTRVLNDGARLTYSGIAMLHPELFADCRPGRFSLAPLLRRAIADGRVRGQLHEGAWFDCGSPANLEAARRACR